MTYLYLHIHTRSCYEDYWFFHLQAINALDRLELRLHLLCQIPKILAKHARGYGLHTFDHGFQKL